VRVRRTELTFWAFLLAVAYLPLPLGFIAWLALARPIGIISRLEPQEAFRAAYFYSFMANLFHLYWVAVVTPPGMVAAIFVLSLYPAVVMTAFVRLYRIKKILGMIALPFLWVGMEYFRSLSEFAFPWTDLSYSQGYYLIFIQIVSVLGCYGLSFILVIMNMLVWRVIDGSNRLEARINGAVALVVVAAAVFVYGWIVYPPVKEVGDFRVSMLQGNVDLSTKWNPQTRDYNFELYDSLARVAAEDEPRLIVWPETAAPTYPRQEPGYLRKLYYTAAGSGTPNLVGALDIVYYPDKKKSYNAAFQISPTGRIDAVHHKIELVPFSEHSPYQDYVPFLTREYLSKYLDIIRTREVQWWSDFYPGDSIVIFEAGGRRYAVLICFESAFPEQVRQCLLKGADFMVNITNDTWFGRSAGPFQHMRIAVFRAVENRVWMARCANSGISAFIDPYGREVHRAGLYVQKVISADVGAVSDYSVFTRLGPVVGQVSFVVLLLIMGGLIIGRVVGRIRRGGR